MLGNYSTIDYVLARWGEYLMSWHELEQIAIKKYITKVKIALEKVKMQIQLDEKLLNAMSDSLLGMNIRVYSLAYYDPILETNGEYNE